MDCDIFVCKYNNFYLQYNNAATIFFTTDLQEITHKEAIASIFRTCLQLALLLHYSTLS